MICSYLGYATIDRCIHRSTCLSISLFVYRPMNLFEYQMINLSIYLSMFLQVESMCLWNQAHCLLASHVSIPSIDPPMELLSCLRVCLYMCSCIDWSTCHTYAVIHRRIHRSIPPIDLTIYLSTHQPAQISNDAVVHVPLDVSACEIEVSMGPCILFASQPCIYPSIDPPMEPLIHLHVCLYMCSSIDLWCFVQLVYPAPDF